MEKGKKKRKRHPKFYFLFSLHLPTLAPYLTQRPAQVAASRGGLERVDRLEGHACMIAAAHLAHIVGLRWKIPRRTQAIVHALDPAFDREGRREGKKREG